MPPYVLVNSGGNGHPGAGFRDPSLTPVPVADPEKGIENTELPSYLTESVFKRRLTLADRIDSNFRKRYAGYQLESYNQMYKDAVKLMGGTDLEAFDLTKEKEEVKEQSNEDFFFNQDIDYNEGIKSPGWVRLQKRKLIK